MHKKSFARYVCKENKQKTQEKPQVDLVVVPEATARASIFSVRLVTEDALPARGGAAFDAMKTMSASVLRSQSRETGATWGRPDGGTMFRTVHAAGPPKNLSGGIF